MKGFTLIKADRLEMRFQRRSSFVNDQPQCGFTLIELLISIAIMGLVFGIVLTATSLVKRNAGDTARQGDLRSIQSALEQYHSDQGFYPAAINFGSPLTNQTGNPVIIPTASIKTYLNKAPDDADASRHYCYQSQLTSDPASLCTNATQTAFCQNYQLFAVLDTPSSTQRYTCRGSATSYSLVVTQP